MPFSFLESRKRTFLFSLGALGATILLIAFLIAIRPSPALKSEIEEEQELFLDVLTLTKQTHPLNILTYGTVSPYKKLNLQAPFAGTALAKGDLFSGKFIPAGLPIYTMDTRQLEIDKKNLSLDLDLMDLNVQQLHKNLKLLQNRRTLLESLVATGRKLLEQQQERLTIEERLYQNIATLFEQKTASQTEFLRAKNRLLDVSFSTLQAEERLAASSDQLEQLELQITNATYELKGSRQQIEKLEKQIEKIDIQLAKGKIVLDFPIFIEEVMIPYQQEVGAGTPLATARSASQVELKITLPDHYLRWVNTGLDGWERQPVDIQLVNHRIQKDFTGGYIHSVDSSVTSPTRSLSILIRRMNPLDAKSRPLADEELKPGMYCRVNLKLAHVPDTFLIPTSFVDSHRTFFQLVLKGEKYQLVPFKDFEVVEETADGLVVQTDSTIDSLMLVHNPPTYIAPHTLLYPSPEEALSKKR